MRRCLFSILLILTVTAVLAQEDPDDISSNVKGFFGDVRPTNKKASESIRDRLVEHLRKLKIIEDRNQTLLELLRKYKMSYEYTNEEILQYFETSSPNTDLKDVRMKLEEEKVMDLQKISKPVLVQIEEGLLQGRKVYNEKSNLEYYAFLGIPYAEPPERFQAPVPLKPWDYVKDATKGGSHCWHFDRFLDRPVGSEDCLFANINTPSMENKKLPVFVWVHGGAFNFGSGNVIQNGPSRVLKNGVVYASFNYRLGAFGFLSSGTREAPGNAGMKDTVEFLRWLKRNVKYFGGDPDNITLYGVSSAGSMVEYLLLSPMAKDLFHKAIIISGSSLSFWSFTDHPLQSTFKLARSLGSFTSDIDEVMRLLKNTKPEEIVVKEIMNNYYESPVGDYISFVPCAEDSFPGVEPFIQERPEIIMGSGNFTQMPVMYGFNSDEGIIYLDTIPSKKNIIHVEEFFLPFDLFSKTTSVKKKKQTLKKINKKYFNKGYSDQGFATLSGDFRFTMGVYFSIKNQVYQSKYPVYFYEFAFDGSMSSFRLNPIIDRRRGVGHADDLYYVLDQLFYPFTEVDQLTEAVANRQTYLYTNFAKYGNPSPEFSGLTEWFPVSDMNRLEYMQISAYMEMKLNPFRGRSEIWEELEKLRNMMD